jgi:predicted GH43/DUF377 family glycosyl hydrolase
MRFPTLIVFSAASAAAAYKVVVTDRCVTGQPLINSSHILGYPNVLNPAWLPLPDGSGGLFVRVSTPTSQPNFIAFVTSLDGVSFSPVVNASILLDGPPDTPAATAMDPRAIHRKSTGDSFVTYQLYNRVAGQPKALRQTVISSTRTPQLGWSWRRMNQTMFPTMPDCGTALWFPHDTAEKAGAAFAVATLRCQLRGGNLSLVSSTDGLRTWREERMLLTTRPAHRDNATLSAGPAPVRLSDGNWLLLYNVDNKWPVDHPRPLPPYGRCALGWAILEAGSLKVIARAEEPLVSAALPWEVHGMTAKVVYTDGIREEHEPDTFTVYAGGADSVVEAFRIRVLV